MTVKLSKFVRKPFYVDGVQVTSANIDSVAGWCMGEVRTSGKGDPDIETIQDPTTPKTRVPEKYIKVNVQRPLNDRQTMAFVGDWILYAGTGFKVYTPVAFQKSFEAVPIVHEVPLPDVDRDAGTGQFVTEAYAENHPATTVHESGTKTIGREGR